MNLFKAINLLLSPDLWETAYRTPDDDKLILKDGSIYFFSDCSVNFRRVDNREIYYQFPIMLVSFILILSSRLNKLVRRREMLEHNKN